VRLAVMMIDGIELKGRTNVVALGVTTEGVKIPLGLWEGSTENATVATALLSDLVDRGLDPEQGILFVIDGAKALRKAIRTVFGERAVVQRCVRHKERNVLEHLPERDRPPVKRRLRSAWAHDDHAARSTSCASSPPSSTASTPAPRVAARGPRGDAHPHPPRRPRPPRRRRWQSPTRASR
jgi:transposase-like protein